jgi:hypothetical protein
MTNGGQAQGTPERTQVDQWMTTRHDRRDEAPQEHT